MNPKRLDGWDQQEEQQLAEIILRAISKGETQLSAFQDAGQKLKRTPTACGHRWNRVLREQYSAQIEAAKQQWRTMQSKQLEQDTPQDHTDGEPEYSTEHVIEMLKSHFDQHPIKESENKISNELQSLREEVAQLFTKIDALHHDVHFILEIFGRLAKHSQNGNQDKGRMR